MRIFAVVALVGTLGLSQLSAQTFVSGSTGADGALNLATLNCDTGALAPLSGQTPGCWIQLPESGVLNYTTINVPLGKTLNFRKNLRNTPVILLAQGDVLIEGTVSVDSTTWLPDNRYDPTGPGPGGFPGGATPYGAGMGPGGGTPYNPQDPTQQNTVGHWVGPLSLMPIVGGSGGGVWNNGYGGSFDGTGGGGGLVIASSGQITIAQGGILSAVGVPVGCSYLGLGSGGAVRLVANRISEAGRIQTGNGYPCNYSMLNTVPGIVRLEAPDGMISYTGTSVPPPILSVINLTVVPSNVPSLRIVSVGGFLVPDSAGNRKDAADLVLPKQLPDPINVVVAASNIPVGSPVTVSFGTSNQGTAPAVPLAGTLANSTATIGVSGLNRDQLAYLYVQVLFAPPASNMPESGRVTQVRMTTAPGAKPQFTFLRRDGAEVPVNRLPAELRAWVSKPYSR